MWVPSNYNKGRRFAINDANPAVGQPYTRDFQQPGFVLIDMVRFLLATDATVGNRRPSFIFTPTSMPTWVIYANNTQAASSSFTWYGAITYGVAGATTAEFPMPMWEIWLPAGSRFQISLNGGVVGDAFVNVALGGWFFEHGKGVMEL